MIYLYDLFSVDEDKTSFVFVIIFSLTKTRFRLSRRCNHKESDMIFDILLYCCTQETGNKLLITLFDVAFMWATVTNIMDPSGQLLLRNFNLNNKTFYNDLSLLV